MKKLYLLVLFLLISINGYGLEIFEVQKGYMCGVKTGISFVCHETEDILLTDQGECTFNGEKKACTWYGYSFMYSENEEGTKLDCIYSSTQLATLGDPTKIDEKNTNYAEFELELNKESGFFSNPLYSTYNLTEKKEPPETARWECSYNGKSVFDIELRFHAPSLPF